MEDFIPPGLICCLMYLPGEETTDSALCIGEEGGLGLLINLIELLELNLFTRVTFGDFNSSRFLGSLKTLKLI